MARILALVAAVGLVAGAVVLRGAIDGDDQGGKGGDTSLGAIWCDPLLAEACTAAARGAARRCRCCRASAWPFASFTWPLRMTGVGA